MCFFPFLFRRFPGPAFALGLMASAVGAVPCAAQMGKEEKGFGEFPQVFFQFWDTTGHWGLVEFTEFAEDIAFQRTYWANGVRYDDPFDVLVANLAPGTPVFIQANSGISDCIAAWSWIGAPETTFYIPFDGSQVEGGFFEADIMTSDMNRIQFSIQVYVGKYSDSPSEIVWANLDLIKGLDSTLRVNFLEGNVKHGDPPFVKSSPVQGVITARFGAENCSDTPTIDFCSEEMAPVGPLEVIYSVEGYTSDSIILDAENLKGYGFNFLLFSLPESNVPSAPLQFGTGEVFPEETDYPTSPSCIPVGILRDAQNRRINAWMMNGKESR
ncbi:MAG: hypothetical protein RLY93_01815 [Sumerlaeia bacterium]